MPPTHLLPLLLLLLLLSPTPSSAAPTPTTHAATIVNGSITLTTTFPAVSPATTCFHAMLDARWTAYGLISQWPGCTPTGCKVTMQAPPGSHSIASYVSTAVDDQCSQPATDADRSITHLGATDVEVPLSGAKSPWSASTPPQVTPTPPGGVVKRNFSVGTYYTTVNLGQALAYQKAEAIKGSPPCTVEDVIRSNGGLNFSSCLEAYGVHEGGLYLDTPAKFGFYCTYLPPPPGSYHPPVNASQFTACPNVTDVLEFHAGMLSSTGVDYVLLDGTNLGNNDTQQYVLQQRPAEVIVDHWLELRAQGTPTPDFVVWNTVKPGTTTWQTYLDLFYNNATRAAILPKAPSGKYLFWVVGTGIDPSIPPKIESNGGRNNVVAASMWANINSQQAASGECTFFEPCSDGTDNLYTTVPQPGNGTCSQLMTSNAPIGTFVSTNHAYQLSRSSSPFGTTTKQGGWTFRAQFFTALQKQPDHIFVSSFNEHVGGPYAMPSSWTNPFAGAVGLEWTHDRRNTFVDGMGVARSRAWEPTVQGGDAELRLQQSCLRVAALGRLLDYDVCAVPNEACCVTTNDQLWTPVWALKDVRGSNDTLLTVDPHEVSVLTGGGQWREVCTGYGEPLSFCIDMSLVSKPGRDLVEGPFILRGSGNTTQPTVPLYRCRSAAGRHFFSVEEGCEGSTMESQLGWMSAARTSQTPRSLRRCSSTSGTKVFVHGLDSVGCEAGYNDDGVLGFVV